MDRKNWDEDENYWNESVRGFNLDVNRKYNFDEISKFSTRTKAQGSSMRSAAGSSVLSFSTGTDEAIDIPQLKCTSCNKIITDGDIMYEGDKVFTNQVCWKHWIDRMIETENYNIKELYSNAAKRYFLNRICQTCNGRLITKVILLMKNSMDESQFGSLMYEHNVAYNHYMAFLSQSGQTDSKLLRLKNPSDEVMRRLDVIFNDNCQVTGSTVENFIRLLDEFRDDLRLNTMMTMQCELITEYINLLRFQKQFDPDMINASLIQTLTGGAAYEVFSRNSVEKLRDFKITSEEFFWSTLVSVVRSGKLADIDKLLNFRGFGSKPSIEFERIVGFLMSLDQSGMVGERELYEAKMRCLTKISNVGDMVAYANTHKLLPQLLKYCQDTNDKSTLKKINQIMKG